MSIETVPSTTDAPTSNRRLRLRPPQTGDETAFTTAHRAMAGDGFTFGLGFEPGTDWHEYLRHLDDTRRGVNLASGFVPMTFLVADVDGEIVGRTSVRHTLNEHLAHQGGHIGYGVLAQHRRRGYATEILRQSLVVARANGVDSALVTCDDDNTGSISVIESSGGRFDSLVHATEDGRPVRRYWIY